MENISQQSNDFAAQKNIEIKKNLNNIQKQIDINEIDHNMILDLIKILENYGLLEADAEERKKNLKQIYNKFLNDLERHKPEF